MARLLSIPTSTLHALLTGKDPSVRLSTLETFDQLLKKLCLNLESSLWPELFLPEMQGIRYAMFLRTGMWAYTISEEEPFTVNDEWFIKTLTSDFEKLPINLIRYHPVPEFPSPPVPRMFSLVKQVEGGWVKVHDLPWDRKTEMIKLNGRQHIPGNYEKLWFQK